MKISEYLLYLGFFVNAAAQITTVLDAYPVHIIGTLLKFMKLVDYVVVDIQRNSSALILYKFIVSKGEPYYLYEKQWIMQSDVMNSNEIVDNVHEIVGTCHCIKQRKRKKTSVSIILDEELHNEIMSDKLCELLVKEFSASGFVVKEKSCLFLNNNSKIFLFWLQVALVQGWFYEKEELESHAVVYLEPYYAGISFIVNDKINLTGTNADELLDIKIRGQSYKIYSKGVSELGWLNARAEILRAQNEGVQPSSYKSDCIHPNLMISYNIGNQEYTVTGTFQETATAYSNETLFGNELGSTPKLNYNKCVNLVAEVVKKFKKPPRIGHLSKHTYSLLYTEQIYASFNPRVLYKTKLSTVKKISEKACKSNLVRNPWLCLNFVYSYVLLRDYFQFDDEDKIMNTPAMERLRRMDYRFSLAYLNLQKTILTDYNRMNEENTKNVTKKNNLRGMIAKLF